MLTGTEWQCPCPGPGDQNCWPVSEVEKLPAYTACAQTRDQPFTGMTNPSTLCYTVLRMRAFSRHNCSTRCTHSYSAEATCAAGQKGAERPFFGTLRPSCSSSDQQIPFCEVSPNIYHALHVRALQACSTGCSAPSCRGWRPRANIAGIGRRHIQSERGEIRLKLSLISTGCPTDCL